MKKIVITERQLESVILEDINHNIYFDTFSSAVQHARHHIEEKGYEINESDWWNEVTVGNGRPKDGHAAKMTIGLTKNGIPQKKRSIFKSTIEELNIEIISN